MIGKDKHTFEIKFSENWMKKGEILSASNNQKVEIVSEPTPHYNKWLWKMLNFLTFKFFFNVRYTYICRLEK